MRKLFVSLATVALFMGFLATPAFSQGDIASLSKFLAGKSVSDSQTAVDGDAAIIVRYIGANQDAQIEVEAAGNILFTEDTGSGLAADASVVCPVGGTGGTIDVSDTECDTMDEVIDIINADASWAAAAHATLGTLSSDNTLATLAATSNVMRPEGVDLNTDTLVSDDLFLVLSDNQNGRDYFTTNGGLIPNPYRGKRAALFHLLYNLNLSDGAQLLTIYSVLPENLTGGSSETVTTLFSIVLADATATDVTMFQNVGISGRNDEKLLLGIQDSGAFAAVTYIYAYGYEFDVP